MEPNLTNEEVMRRYGISISTLNRWVQEEFIPVRYITKKVWVFVASELEAWEKKKARGGRISPRRQLEEVGA
ncbi:MAG: helix-turn-helix domain-containing protein [Smithella sp.]